ncbi:Lunapark b isoform 1 [Mycena chlorophos]|uniref:Endoplasmic reticulum junction formation protein lunapark n=1 Tax=Mycena chlorophos TaxID=658473 RepID=A0A8H6TRP7_MYCCL|nr:Lunapark b isoform 1 [Mycena chlorophos]
MSFLLRLFRSKQPASDDYETILSTLASNIRQRQQMLADIRQRQRRATTLVTLYTLAGWGVYLASWYFGFVSGDRHGGGGVPAAERAVRALPVFVGPVFILFIRRIVQLWYTRKGNQEEQSLQVLMKEQREKVEEIKKKTNFYSTRDLLSRYDQVSAPGTPQRAGPGQQLGVGAGGPGSVQQRGAGPRPSVPANGGPTQQQQSLSISTSTPPRQQQPQQPPQQQHPPQQQNPPRRTIFDALADLLIGAEDAESAPASQRFALICEKCFAHNGLVHEADWADAQYRCPKCGHFNASPRSRRVIERASASPLGLGLGMQGLPDVGGGAASGPAGAGSVSTPTTAGLQEGAGGKVRRRVGKAGARGGLSSDDGEGEGEGEERMEVDPADD